jgi:hypothetical protein
MVETVISVSYIVVAILVFYRSLKYFDSIHVDGDPEGLDALTSLWLAGFWPIFIPIFILYKLLYRLTSPFK